MDLRNIEKVFRECERSRNNQPCGITSHGALLQDCALVWIPDIKRAAEGSYSKMLCTLTCFAWPCVSLELVSICVHTSQNLVWVQRGIILQTPPTLQDRILRFVVNPQSVTSLISTVVSLFLQRHQLAGLCESWTHKWVLPGSKDWSRGCWQESRDMVNLHAFPVSLSQPAGRPLRERIHLFKCKFFCINSQNLEHCILLNLCSIYPAFWPNSG